MGEIIRTHTLNILQFCQLHLSIAEFFLMKLIHNFCYIDIHSEGYSHVQCIVKLILPSSRIDFLATFLLLFPIPSF